MNATLQTTIIPKQPLTSSWRQTPHPATDSQTVPKQSSQQSNSLVVKIAATYTGEPLERVMCMWGQELDLPLTIDFCGYNQLFQNLLNPASEMAQNRTGINVLLVRLQDWVLPHGTATADTETSVARLQEMAGSFVQALTNGPVRQAARLIVAFCPSAPALDSRLAEQLAAVETTLLSKLGELENVYSIGTEEQATHYPVANFYDAQGDQTGHIPYTPAYFAALSTLLVRQIHTLCRTPYKVVVLDCDNTLWGGVCGEDGAMGVQFDAPYIALQHFMLRQQEAGMLLCLCSKNQEADVLEVFAQRPEMPLKQAHLVAWRINWEPKSQNLQALAQELNLGLDSFIFVDDNPVECAEVQTHCPEVLTLQLPTDPAKIPHFLEHIWAFDQLKVTAEDQQRTQLYQQNVQRERVRRSSASLADFLAGLELQIEVAPLTPTHLPRVAQLTQRTNQFNFTTRRRTEGQLQALHQQTEIDILTVHVTDRFGDYGLVGMLITEQRQDSLLIDTFLLSCRVLGRGVEQQMMKHLAQMAQFRGLAWIEADYLPTPKNQPAANFLIGLGQNFVTTDEQRVRYRFPIAHLMTYHPAPEEQPPTDKRQEIDSQNPVESDYTRTYPKQTASELFNRIAQKMGTVPQVLQRLTIAKVPRPPLQQPYVAPQNATERLLAAIWSEVMNIEGVGVDDSLSDLGGDSLEVVQIHSQLASRLQLPELAVTRLFQFPTVASMAAFLDKGDREAGTLRTTAQQRAVQQRTALLRQRQTLQRMTR